MKPFIALALLVASASAASYGSYGATMVRAAPQASYSDYSYGSTVMVKQIPITSFSQNIRGSQENDLIYTTGNGISVTDNTQAVNRPSSYDDGFGRMVQSDTTLQKTGSFSFTTNDGQQISLNYQADENGFRASGSHLPIAPAPVEKTPEVQQAEQEHFALFREAEAKLASMPKYSDDSVRSYGYAAPTVVRSSSYDAPAVIRTSSYTAPAVVRVEPTQVVIRSNGY